MDDISGIVADGAAPNTALVYQPTPEVLGRYQPFLRGIMDLRAGMASTDAAQQVLTLMRSADSAEADSARTKGIVADVMGGAGIVAAGVGIVLLVTRPKPATQGVAVSPWRTARTVGLSVSF